MANGEGKNDFKEGKDTQRGLGKGIAGFKSLNPEVLAESVVDELEQANTPRQVKPVRPSSITDILAIDIGYGGTKAISDMAGGKVLHFPSFVSTAISMDATPTHVATDITVLINDTEYHYGKRAIISDPRVSRLTLDDREHDTAMVVLYHATLAEFYKNYEHVDLYVVSGLPNQSRMSTEGPLLALLKGNEDGKFVVNYMIGKTKKSLTVNVLNVRINTQPEGFYVNLMRDANLEKINSADYNYFGVLDFGHYTFDYTIFNGADMVGLGGRYTNSYDGMYKAHEHLAKLLQEEYASAKFRPHQSDVELALQTGSIKVRGEVQDVSDLVSKVISTYARQSFEHILGRWEPILDNLDGIFMEGGGSVAVAPLLAQHFVSSAQYKRTFLAEDPEYSNVQGYLKLGRILFGKEVSR